jgi:hypothetical protein
MIFNKLEELSNSFIEKLKTAGQEIDEGHKFPWTNRIFRSDRFRRAHIDIVDAREVRKLYMMHLCIFPNINDDSPIYGFDLIAGPNKITGAFHDYSATSNKDHFMINWFCNQVNHLEWSKPRNLPDWAKNIFSPSMIAAGNITKEKELATIINIATDSLDYYLSNVGSNSSSNSLKEQEYYCENQRKNPHTPKVMESLGFDSDTVNIFIRDCLFPSVNHLA